MSKINWDDVRLNVELLYPTFRKYVRKYKGYLCCSSCAEIKLWYEFMEFVEKVEALNKQDKEVKND